MTTRDFVRKLVRRGLQVVGNKDEPVTKTVGPTPERRPTDIPGALFVSDGFCPVCAVGTTFVAYGEWLRDHYVCARCGSVPRERALMVVLEAVVPSWRTLRVHESSPGRPASDKLRRECPSYIATHYFPDPDVAPGSVRDGFRCENLEAQTFADGAFDLVITQDVMEHVLDPGAAFREIARTLVPGGHHVFTTPVCANMPRSQARARRGIDGNIEYLAPPEYHGNPIDPAGSLVTMLYGTDIAEFVETASGLRTRVYRDADPVRGIVGEFLDVMVSVKDGPAAAERSTGR